MPRGLVILIGLLACNFIFAVHVSHDMRVAIYVSFEQALLYVLLVVSGCIKKEVKSNHEKH